MKFATCHLPLVTYHLPPATCHLQHILFKETQHMTTTNLATQKATEEAYHLFGNSVRTIRRANDLTQAQLAERAGMNKTYLVRIESGDKNVTLKTAQRIACALDMELTTLLKGVHVRIEGM